MSISGEAVTNLDALSCLQVVEQLGISGTGVSSLRGLERLIVTGGISVSANKQLEEVSFPALWSGRMTHKNSYDLLVSDSPTVRSVSAERLTVANVDVDLDLVDEDTPARSLNLPALVAGVNIRVSGVSAFDLGNLRAAGRLEFRETSLKTVNVPKVAHVGAFSLIGETTVEAISLPNLESATLSLFIASNAGLRELDLASLKLVGIFNVSSNASLPACDVEQIVDAIESTDIDVEGNSDECP